MTPTRHPDGMSDLHHVDAYLTHLTHLSHPTTTVDSYRSALTQAAAQLPHGLLSLPEEITAWLGTRHAPNTRAAYATALRGAYRWWARTGRIDHDPMDGMDLPRWRRGLPRPVTHEQLATLLARAPDPERTWCLLAAYAGLRCCEIARLDRGDITREAIYVRGKGDRPGVVPTHPLIWAAVAELPGGPLAAGRTPDRVSARISVAARRAGLTGVTAHRLRHWAGTWWQAATGDLRVTQELLRHASPATTAVYTAVSDGARRAAVLALPVNGTSAAS